MIRVTGLVWASKDGLMDLLVGPRWSRQTDWHTSFFVYFEDSGSGVFEVDCIDVAA